MKVQEKVEENFENKMYNFNCLLNIIRETSSRTMEYMGVSTHGGECVQSFDTIWK